MDINSGILTCWFLTNGVYSGDASGTISLMKTNTSTPEFTDRVAGIVVKDDGFYYRYHPTSGVTSFADVTVSANKWYKFEIWFNCTTDKASFFVYDEGGVLLGSVDNTNFISPATSIGRLDVTTNRDEYGSYYTCYWDDIKIIPELGYEYRVGERYSEDFESYTNGEDIIDKNGWIEDLGRPKTLYGV